MHQGYCHYTIGQRKGLGIALGAPKFVTKIDAENNRVTLGDRDDLITTQATIADVRIRDWDWLKESPHVQARIRYKSPAVEALVNYELGIKNYELTPELNIPHSTFHITFSTPVWGVTPGQSLVIYKDNLVVGGGIIQ